MKVIHRSRLKNTELHIDRPIYTLEDLHRESQYSVTQYSFRSRVRKCLGSISPKKCLLTSMPVLTWWPEYNWKKYFKADLICGMTVFVMQIPQSMAYGLLANVPPVFGLYMAFYHALIYSVFGTSRQLSMGPFAITCLLTGDVIIEKTTVEILPNGTKKIVNPEYVEVYGQVTNTQVGVTVALAVAIAEFGMYLIRLGIIANLLSDTMVSGFTCAAAYQVAASQIDDLLGLRKIVKRTGNFSLLFSLYDLLWALPTTNQMAVLISGVSFLLIFLNNALAKPWMIRTCKIFFPMEIAVVIAGTTVSYTTRIYETHNVTTAGPIPVGLPLPTLPVIGLLSEIWMDAIVIALVAYITALSLALMFARKLMYEVDANQELLAYSLCNFIGSFVSCLPTGASMCISVLQEKMGGVTQIASMVSSSLLLLVLYFVGPFFEVLPRCVLATVITVALKNLLFQVKELPLHWRLSHWDGFVWAVTFVSTLVFQISVGLATGVAASLFSVAVQGLRLHAALLGRFNDTDLYLDMDHNKAAVELPGMKLLHYVGGVSFASRKSFKDLFVDNIGFDPAAVLRKKKRLNEKGLDLDEVAEGLEMMVIILDFSSVTFLDPSGVDYLRHLQSDLHKLGITLLLAECSVRETIGDEAVKWKHPLEHLLNAVPLLRWLPKYNYKDYLIPDIISGVTVFIMQIPQGMAYGLLAHVSPVYGLYMAFYQVLIYFVFGTSRHISIGTFAVTCLMTGKVVSEFTTVEILPNGTTISKNPEVAKQHGDITNTEVGVTLTFLAAIMDLMMFIFRMGAISTLLSDTMVSGFTCAAAFHVAASQIKDLLGLTIPPTPGNFSILRTLYNAALDIPHANVAAIIMSATCILVQVLCNELFKPWLAKICKVPFPIEIIVVVVTTAITYFAGLYESYGITIVGPIPQGLASISVPVFTLMGDIWMDAVIITLVGYTTALSMALIFARKLNYKVDANQELLAHEAVGGVTQIASVVSSILILIVLLWVGQLFEMLPRCVLASVIMVALQGLLFQVKKLPLYWRLSHWDGFVWAVTFFTTLIVQISFGLVAGIAASIFTLAMQSFRLKAYVMGRLPGTDLYLAKHNYYRAVQEVSGIKIIHFVGGLSFASKLSFRSAIVRKIGFDPAVLEKKRAKLLAQGLPITEEEELLNSQVIIFDFNSITFLDPTGVETLRNIQTEFSRLNVSVFIAESSGRAYQEIKKCNMLENKDSYFQIFPTIHDAVLYAQANNLK